MTPYAYVIYILSLITNILLINFGFYDDLFAAITNQDIVVFESEPSNVTVSFEYTQYNHAHSFSETYRNYDDDYHWRECDKCGYIESYMHQVGKWYAIKEETYLNEGIYERYCDRCNYVEQKIVPKIECEHSFLGGWGYSSQYHWKKADCGCDVISSKEEHKDGEWKFYLETETQIMYYRKCECGYIEYKTEVK